LTQAVDVHLHEVCLAIKMAIPNVLDDFTARHKFGGVKQEKLQECKFLGRQRDYILATSRPAPMTVQQEVCIAESCVSAMEAPSHKGPHTRQEFCQDKGLGEIVIRTGVQALHPLLDQASSCEHQDRSLYSSLAQLAADLDPAKAGQSDIEKNGIVSDVCAQCEGLLTRFGHIHRIGILTQGTRDEVADLPFVFD